MIKNFGSNFIIGGMYFFDENTGVIAGTNGSKASIKRTSDGGENWEDVLEGDYNFPLECLHFDGDNGWTAGKYGSNNGIFKSVDGGETWELNFTGLTGTPYSVFQYDTVSFIVGTSGMIMRFEDEVTKIEKKVLNEKPLVYPCPANETLTIDFSAMTEESGFEIYNLNGKLVLSGNNQRAEKKSFNIQSWPSGIYVLKSTGNQNINHYSNKIIIN